MPENGYHTLLGEGSFGSVYKAFNKKKQKLVAVKQVKRDEEWNVPFSTFRELSLLKDLDHANIVKLEDFFVQNGYFYIVFELMSMDLKKFMDLMPHGELMNKTLVKIYCRQILAGISYCHDCKMMHRDLKPQNLLVGDHGTIKIADFGLSRVLEAFNLVLTQQCEIFAFGRVKRLGLGTLENVLTFFRRALELIEGMESQS